MTRGDTKATACEVVAVVIFRTAKTRQQLMVALILVYGGENVPKAPAAGSINFLGQGHRTHVL